MLSMLLKDLFGPGDFLIGFDPRDKWDAIASLVEHVAAEHGLSQASAERLLGAVIARERSMSTGMRASPAAARFAAYAVVQEQTDPYAKAIQQLVEHSQELERSLRALERKLADVERSAEEGRDTLRAVR